jgi:hypothetical protein
MGENEFVYGPAEEPRATNLTPRMGARDRQGESEEAQADLREVSAHGGVMDTAAGPVAGLSRQILGQVSGMREAMPEAGTPIAEPKGRERQHRDVDKPTLDPRLNYVGAAGVGGDGNVEPNTAAMSESVQGPEDLDS